MLSRTHNVHLQSQTRAQVDPRILLESSKSSPSLDPKASGRDMVLPKQTVEKVVVMGPAWSIDTLGWFYMAESMSAKSRSLRSCLYVTARVKT